MRVIGLLAWYDEPTKDLERCIRTFHAAGVTALVAVDGAYGLFPGAQPVSPVEQHVLIAQTCAELKIDLRLWRPRELWDTETDKRAFMFGLAEQHLRQSDEDWYCVMDADEYVKGQVDLQGLLRKTRFDAADVTFDEPAGAGKPHKRFELRCLFRALEGLTVRFNHHTYMVGDRILWGYGHEPAEDLTFVTIVHTTNLRPAKRRKLKDTYYADRDDQGIEGRPTCMFCGDDSTTEIRSGYTYDSVNDKLRSNGALVCDRHVSRVFYLNASVLPVLVRGVLESGPTLVDPDAAAGRLVAHLFKHDEIAESFGMPLATVVGLVAREMRDAVEARVVTHA